MFETAIVVNEYVAADTLALLLDSGGKYDLAFDGETLMDSVDFDVVFDVIEQGDRRRFDSLVHCWFVLLGHAGEYALKKDLVSVFKRPDAEWEETDFDISDLKNHRNYTFGISKTPGRGEEWSLHIFDKYTYWEVARL